jgi:glutamate-5-semialdehyde dehydrogenase
LRIARVAALVIGIIYEKAQRDRRCRWAALKSGNAAILRGGSRVSFLARLVAALSEGLRAAGLPEHAIQLVLTRDREAVGMMLKMSGSSTSSCAAARPDRAGPA